MSSSPPASAHRRTKKERVRATRACDRCKLRKERCTGLQPCIACLSAGFECQYNASYRRGRLPKIQTIEDPSSSLDNDGSRSVNLPPPATQEESGTPLDPALDAYRDAQEVIEEDEISIIPQIRVGTQALIQCSGEHNAQPRATGVDLEPHYIGPSSGLSFLLRAQMRLRNTVKSSKATSIFTFGDAPFPEVDCAFLELPPLEEARSLLAVYFDFAFPTHRFLHRPSVEQWLSDFYLHRNRLDLAPGTRERYATVLMVLSQSKLYTPSKLTGDLDIEGSVALYAAAENQLCKETGQIRLTSVQARLAQCFYLLMQSRIHRCWNLFGTTARLAIAVGLHRRRGHQPASDFIVLESRKRVFWCAYSLDIYLSAALGRPRAFHDDDIDQEYPSEVDDSHLFADTMQQPAAPSQRVMTGAIYHAKLCKIISAILKEQYGIRRLSLEEQIIAIEKHSKSLSEWREGIGSFLDGIWINAGLLLPPFSRQCTVLNLAFSHATILTHRPLVLSNFSKLAQPSRTRKGRVQTAIQESNQQCVSAAVCVLEIVTNLCENQHMYGAFWFSQYYAFCALVIIYISVIQKNCENATDKTALLSQAQHCQKLLSMPTIRSSFGERYGMVLEELRAEAVKRIYESHETRQGSCELAQSVNTAPDETTDFFERQLDLEIVACDIDFEGAGIDFGENYAGFSPTSLLAGITSWGQFDTLVATDTTQDTQ